jgi:hypothetical protein
MGIQQTIFMKSQKTLFNFEVTGESMEEILKKKKKVEDAARESLKKDGNNRARSR